ncbi:MAG: SUMF1/EgtB/PvdO family nonheme iron enzyme, partial [Victivallales bacterium]|nr:SUMF1/EgtB/PvdO family nonheme iron enzyme [Victivallales bacterium]
YDDGAPYSWEVGAYPANRWGLHDMHGNVAEWTASSYTATGSNDGVPAVDNTALKVVRGGSWNDMLPQVRSASRWRYPQWQPVYNVGFRVKIE